MTRSFTRFFFLAILLINTFKIAISQTVVINSGIAGTPAYNCGPIYRSSATSSYDASRYAYLYTSDELSAAGITSGAVINIVGWMKNNNATTTGGGFFRIYMKNSSATTYGNATETWANLNTGATMVYENLNQAIPATMNPDYITFPLTGPFVYTGGSLEITTEWDINQVSGSPTTAAFDWVWSTVTDRIYGTGNPSLTAITNMSSTTNSISDINDRRPFIQLTYSPGGPCTAPPIAGNAVANPSSPLCALTPVRLSVSGGSTGLGLTYRWQSFTSAGGPYTNISPDSISSGYTINSSSSSWYRAAVTCSGITVYTDSVQVVINPLFPGGNYTINSALPTGGTNFQSYSDAVNAVKCGTTGSVVFNVDAASGPYNEQVVIPQINTTSATNTITFNGNGTTLQFASADGNARSVIKFDGADYITFKNIDIQAGGGTYGWGIHMTNQADNDSIVNCIITTDGTATTTNFAGIVISGSSTSATTAGNSASNAVIIGNTINNGYYGIINYGNNVAPFTNNNQIVNNSVNDFYLSGIQSYGSINPIIVGNIIQRPMRLAVTTTYGIYLNTFTSGAQVEKNKISNLFGSIPASTSTTYGMYVSGDGSLTNQNKIVNNLIADLSSEGTQYGIYNVGGAHMVAYHNTISLDYTSASNGATYGLYVSTVDTGIIYINNVVSITRGGAGIKYGIYKPVSTITFVSNYNDIYLNSGGTGIQAFGFNGQAYATLSDWQTATGYDLNSLSIDPLYNAVGTDYTPTSIPLNNRGTPVGVLADISGTARSATNPDIGAYEFTVSGCTSPPVAGDATSPVTTVCANFPLLLQLINNSAGLGQKYQWESSVSSSGPWSPVGGQINVSDTSINATTSLYYRAAVTCGTSTTYSTAVFITVNPALAAGNYSINSGIATGGTNFQTFADALNVLKCGIAGPVVFNVAPGSGPYTEEVIIPSINGTSSTNTVTFNGNGETLQFASANANQRAVVVLNGSDYVTVKNFSINAIGTTYGWGIHITNQAENDSILNCTVTTDVTSTSTFFSGIVISGSGSSATTSGYNANNVVIMGNTVIGGYYGIINYGNNVSPFTTNIKIFQNVVSDFYYYGIYSYGSTNSVIINNKVERLSRTVVTTAYGIYLGTYSTGNVILNNTVSNLYAAAVSSTSTCYGIYITSDGTSTDPNRVINNLVSDINHEGSIYAIYSSGSAYLNIYHNTISLDNAAASAGSTYGLYISTLDTGVAFINNIVSITRGGSGVKYGIYKPSSTITWISNYNDIYINSSGTGAQAVGFQTNAYATLADWQTASSQDINSLSIDPAYTSIGTDYLPTAATLNNRGTPIGVFFDITGSSRSATNPDIGAYEFTVAGCTSPPVAGDATSVLTTVCANANFTLQLQNNSVGLGQTYLWQSAATATGSWTPIGNNSPNSDTTISATSTLYYRAAVTCGASTTFSTPVQVNITQPIAGSFTINSSLPTSGTNFNNFTDAIDAVKCGVSGPVVFDVVSGSGPYTEQITIPNIAGTSPTNTISFNGNGTTIAFASADANNRAVIKLNGADYVTIRNFVIECIGSAYGWGIFMTNQSDYDSIVNCTITTDPASTASTHCGIVISASNISAVSAGDNASNAVIMGNTINNGYYGISNYGQATAPFNDNNQILNNTINDFYYYGIYVYGTSSNIVSGNTIQRVTRATLTTTYGMYLGAVNTNLFVTKNRIHHLYDLATASTSTAYGIYTTAAGADGLENRITNNLISDINHSGSIYGFYNSNAAFMLAYHNTISLDNVSATSGASYGFYQLTNANGVQFKNNIISITRGGTGLKYGIYRSSSTLPLACDYNDVYVMSAGSGSQYFGYQGTALSTITDWRLATTLDSNSVAMDPTFASPSTGDYKPTSSTLDNLGTPLGVNVDIDNTARSITNPDMGAYEFGSIVPVTLKSISAGIVKQNVLLKWITAAEVNLDRFEIERSIKGSGFEKIGSVRSVASGTSYQFEDLEIVNKVTEGSIVYYRLKMADKDGKFKYSPVVNVRISKVKMIASVYPNPFKNRLLLKLDALKSGSGSILITDLTGRILISQLKVIIAEGSNNLVIGQLNNLSKGTYLLKLVYNAETLVFEIVKD